MNVIMDYSGDEFNSSHLKVVGAFQRIKTEKAPKGKKAKESKTTQLTWTDKELAKAFASLKSVENFTGGSGETFSFTGADGETIKVIGLGEKSKFKAENLRKTTAKIFKRIKSANYKSVAFDTQSFSISTDKVQTVTVMNESINLANYSFDKYQEKSKDPKFSEIVLYCADKKLKKKIESSFVKSNNVTNSVNVARDFVNEPPNELNSEVYAKRIESDVKTALKGKGVKTKILSKAEMKKEKMDLFLSVNKGSAFSPKLVHLTYTPKKVTKNTKHFALVGKGLTFDSGGYSLKPGASMVNMKFDMAGSATVYGAFRAAVLNNSPYKITCILGITDNMINSYANTPDAIVKARNGKTVEILNTDAEGRLVLADCLDYACDQNPDFIIDAATLTGACLVALGQQVCAVLGNNDKLINNIKSSCKNQDEYIWQLPIINEWREEMKSSIADLRNIGKGRFAGTATAAAFLECFVKNDIPWAHLDIAGIGDTQAHLPYCPSTGASGLIIRSLHHLLTNG